MYNSHKDNTSILYEDLRYEALAVSANYDVIRQGQIFFMQNGMAGWLEAWGNCAAPDRLTEKTEKGTRLEHNVPGDLHTEVAVLLANMALSVCVGG